MIKSGNLIGYSDSKKVVLYIPFVIEQFDQEVQQTYEHEERQLNYFDCNDASWISSPNIPTVYAFMGESVDRVMTTVYHD